MCIYISKEYSLPILLQVYMKHHQCLFFFFYSKTFWSTFKLKKASSSLESKTGVNEQLVMLKGLYRPKQCK